MAWQLEWENQRQTGAPLLYLELGLKPTSNRKKLAPQLSIKREVLGWLIAARSGHGHFAAYHQRFSHEEEEDWRCSCRNYRTPLHPFRCINARAHRALLLLEKAKRALSTEEILSTLEGAAAFAKLFAYSLLNPTVAHVTAHWISDYFLDRIHLPCGTEIDQSKPDTILYIAVPDNS